MRWDGDEVVNVNFASTSFAFVTLEFRWLRVEYESLLMKKKCSEFLFLFTFHHHRQRVYVRTERWGRLKEVRENSNEIENTQTRRRFDEFFAASFALTWKFLLIRSGRSSARQRWNAGRVVGRDELHVQLCLLEWFNFRRSVGILIIVRTFSPLLVISVNILLLIDFLNYIAQLFTCLLPFSSTHSPMKLSMCVLCVRLFNWKQQQKRLQVKSNRWLNSFQV